MLLRPEPLAGLRREIPRGVLPGPRVASRSAARDMGSGHVPRPARGSWAVGAHCACRLSAVPAVPAVPLSPGPASTAGASGCGRLHFPSCPDDCQRDTGCAAAKSPGGGWLCSQEKQQEALRSSLSHARQGRQVLVTTSLSCEAGVRSRGCRSSRSSSERPLGEAASPAGHPRLGTLVRLRSIPVSLCLHVA